MSCASQPLIEKALAKLALEEAAVVKTKLFINQICEFDGLDLMFPDASEAPQASHGSPSQMRLRPDEFFGKPLATAVRMIFEMRHKNAGGTSPAAVDEIYSVLKAGGYSFPSKDPENQKMGLQVSLSKNNATFRKLPSGLWGLAEWYGSSGPRRIVRRTQANNGATVAAEEDIEEEVPEESVFQNDVSSDELEEL